MLKSEEDAVEINTYKKVTDIKRNFKGSIPEINKQAEKAQQQIDNVKQAVKNYEENKYVKVETKQNDINDVSLKSALDIDKKQKIKYVPYNEFYFWGYTFLIDDLRGDGPVYYRFQIDEYHRLDMIQFPHEL